ncbi:hypothetical protein EON81_11655 [bacterium]|nr:MAG: hypothetical protein EON81_11655 [bacterium]
MRTVRRTHRWALAIALGLPVVGNAQLGGEGLPDLSGIAGALSGAVAPKTTGAYSSGLKVPSVNPGAAAKSIGRQLREKTEAASGQKQPALLQLENSMPKALGMLEDQLTKAGLAKRDFGVAAGYYFITNYEVATGKKVPLEASLVAGRTVAAATAKTMGERFKAMTPAQQESTYEKLLVVPMLLEALADQFDKAGKDAEAKNMRSTAASSFQTLFGTDPASITIDATGKISGLKGGTVTKNTTTSKTTKSTRPPTPKLTAGGLTPASLNGAKILVKYRMTYGTAAELVFDQLVMFPNGTAFDDVPNDPLPSFDIATLKTHLRPAHVGTWKVAGKRLNLTFDGKTESFIKHSSGGWAESDYKSGAFNVYFPIKVATKEQLLGSWKSDSLMTMGVAGGGAPMVAAGSNKGLVFGKDGTFAKAGKSFASATTANMGDAFKSGGDVTTTGGGKSSSQGQWRVDGPLLTTVENGQRGVQLIYILPNWSKTSNIPEILIQGTRWERPEKK